MAIYTPPHTPSSFTMTSSLPPLPFELITTWSSWRPTTKSQTPLTPPQSAHPHRRHPPPVYQPQPTLPSIAHFDHISPSKRHHSPPSHLLSLSGSDVTSQVTPPQDNLGQWQRYEHSDSKQSIVVQQSQVSFETLPDEIEEEHEPVTASPTNKVSDWFSPSHRSCQYIAEKTCEMVCYLWFSTLSQTSSPTKRSRLLQQTPSYIPEHSPETASLQYAVSPAFVSFMQKLLETTQVSQSVIVLSLHYIYRLKLRNRFTNGQAGSEYRVATAAIMLANKFVDE